MPQLLPPTFSSPILLAIVLPTALAAAEQAGSATTVEWPAYAATVGSTRYSPADQVTAENVDKLELAWSWQSPDTQIEEEHGLRQGYFKNTPIMAKGTLYATTPLNQVAAIDPATGATRWVFDPQIYGGEMRRRSAQHRGAAYWSDGQKERLIITTAARQLISIDAKTGQPDPSFGTDGQVDLGKGFSREINERQLSFSAPPAIVRDVIVVGSIVPDEAQNPDRPPGDVRGYDVHTGKLLWTFHTIPHPGEEGHDSWEEGSWEKAGAANVWSMISGDEELGTVYLPTGTPSNDFYGGHRPGNNLFAESIVCLDAKTGQRLWHFQTTHHGLWDYDLPAPPILVDITVDGQRIQALAQVSKQGFTYVLDRRTGMPVWPIVEKPVPQSDVPGERTAATQPFPTKPPAFERQGFAEDDLIDFTPELLAMAKETVKNYRMGPLFTPPALIDPETGAGATLQLPGAAGGANWGSAGVDAEEGVLYVQSATRPSLAGIVEPRRGGGYRYVRGGSWAVPTMPNGLHPVKPPWGRITAIDLNRGEILWQVPHGAGPKDNPDLAGLDLPDLGWPSNTTLSASGALVTKTLVFFSQAAVEPNGNYSPTHRYLRAFDKKTGEVLWQKRLEQAPYGVPMTYVHGGRQYLVVAAGGRGEPAELLAFALPTSP